MPAEPREEGRAGRRWRMTPGVYVRGRSIPTLRRSRRDPTPSTWMKTRRRCSQRLGLVWPTPGEKRPSVRPGRSSSRKPNAWPLSRNAGNSRPPALK
ncbi:unnamed protein product, partial [Ectocarpus fasciculatus]